MTCPNQPLVCERICDWDPRESLSSDKSPSRRNAARLHPILALSVRRQNERTLRVPTSTLTPLIAESSPEFRLVRHGDASSLHNLLAVCK